MPHESARRFLPLLILLALTTGACAPSPERAGGEQAGGERAAAPAAGVVDSALPIDTLLHRFRTATHDTVQSLTGGATSPEALARALLVALARRDTTAVRSLVMTRAEFAWLYYPHTKFTAAPYELGPDLVWIPMLAATEKGAGRLLDRLGGQPLRFEALTCPDPAVHEGPNAITAGCQVRFAVADATPRTLRLFAGLLNRDGRYKFLSYANDL